MERWLMPLHGSPFQRSLYISFFGTMCSLTTRHLVSRAKYVAYRYLLFCHAKINVDSCKTTRQAEIRLFMVFYPSGVYISSFNPMRSLSTGHLVAGTK